VPAHDAVMQAAGYVPSIEIDDGESSTYRLWVRE
jgi:hypothetical protein